MKTTVSICYIPLWLLQLVLIIRRLQAQSDDETYLILANRPFVRKLNLNNRTTDILFHNVRSSVLGLDLDIRTREVFWSDVFQRNIVQADLSGRIIRTLVDQQIREPAGVAWDWISKKLYWVDTSTKTLEVIDPSTGYRKALFRFKNKEPRAITLDPVRRWIYWSAWSEEAFQQDGEIIRTSMDGKSSTVLLNESQVTWPNGIALDHDSQTLYWVDALKDTISQSRTDGSNSQILISLNSTKIANSWHSFGVDYYNGEIFFGNWLNDSLFSLSVANTTLTRVVQLTTDPGSVRAVDEERQPTGENPCAVGNGGCTHLCLLSNVEPSGYSCVCPDEIDPLDCEYSGGIHELTGIAPRFTENGEPPREFAVHTHGVDNNVVLPCTVTGTPRPTVRWFKENTRIEQRFVRSDGTLSQRLNANDLSFQGTLYHCTATNRIGQNSSSVVVLRSRYVNVTLAYFNGFRSTITRTIDLEAVTNGPIALECDYSSSNPPPEVVWYDDQGTVIAEILSENTIRYLEGGRYLLIRTLTSAQRARRYHCELSNFIDNFGLRARAPTTYALSRDLPKDGFIQYLDLGTQSGRVGEVLTFAYVAAKRDSGGQFDNYNLACEGGGLLSVTTQNSIFLSVILSEAATTTPEVTFTCSLLGLGTSQTIEGSVRVIRDLPPMILNPLTYQTDRDRRAGYGSGLRYHCIIATGQALVTITWYYNGEPIRSGNEGRIIHRNGTLTIQNPQVSHTGIYQCFATNQFGDSINTWVLEVREEAQIIPINFSFAFFNGNTHLNCSEKYSVFTCTDPRSSVLFDKVRPELVRLGGSSRVGNQLLTLRSNMVNMTFEFDIPEGFTGVRRVEMELLDCEELRVSMRSIMFSASNVHAAILQPRSSCGKLSKVCLPLSSAATSRQMVLNLTARNSLDWIAISSINFYREVESCEEISTNDVQIDSQQLIETTSVPSVLLRTECLSSSILPTVLTGIFTALITTGITILVELAVWKIRKYRHRFLQRKETQSSRTRDNSYRRKQRKFSPKSRNKKRHT